jgi:serine/threonine-protein kinase
VWGTPAYLAPERILGNDAVPATDVYALGVLLFQALSGTSPWRAKNTAQILLAHVCEEPAPLPPIAELPPQVATLYRRCLARNPSNRPTAAEVARVLREARAALKKQSGRNPTAPVAQPSTRRRRGAVLVATAAAALIAAYWGLGGKDPGQADAGPPLPSITFSTGGEGGTAPATTPAGPTAPFDPAHAGAAPSGAGGRPGATGPAGGPAGAGGGSRSGRSPTPTTGSGSSGNGGHSQPVDPRPVDRTLSTVGGSVVARCVGSTASIVSATPLAGYTVGSLNRGPGTQAGVTFSALVTTVRVVVRCSSGVPTASIQVG